MKNYYRSLGSKINPRTKTLIGNRWIFCKQSKNMMLKRKILIFVVKILIIVVSPMNVYLNQ
jgi:hypothetical protein